MRGERSGGGCDTRNSPPYTASPGPWDCGMRYSPYKPCRTPHPRLQIRITSVNVVYSPVP